MNNPVPYLPQNFQRIIYKLKSKRIPPKLILLTIGMLSTIWFLVRVIPKPSRANYPCMKATAPFMSAFVLYLISSGGAVVAFKRFRALLNSSKYSLATLFLIIASVLFLFSNTQLFINSFAGNAISGSSYFTPNEPIGVAKGIFPGRVTWIWNPDATNENCTNTSNNNGVIDTGDNGWFMEKNNNQQIIDSMVIKSLIALTGASDNYDAWDKIFKFFNVSHGKGNTGYSKGQKILLKINATTAFGGLASGSFHADLSRNDNQSVNAFASETNPYIVLSLIRQLVKIAQVPENMIYVGDPARNIYKEFFDLWHAEFPAVHYLGNNLLYPELNIAVLGRTAVAVTTNNEVFWSDHGTVMPDAITDKLFTIFDSIDYLINIPAMKAHSVAGISLAAKNHFGSFTRQYALHLHKGLMDNNDDPVRVGYGLYRVQTDIMMHKLLSGKNLLILIDALYPSDNATSVPLKWHSFPFLNDWCSSIFMSLDPVAIESVCHDFLRTEYNGPTVAQNRPNWFGVDDYLHQAADSSLWPDNITYDPDNDGILIASLGVHEHWNDSINKQYTRNLGKGNGIELFRVHSGTIGIDDKNQLNVRVYPNPTDGLIRLSNNENSAIEFTISDMGGKNQICGIIEKRADKQISLSQLKKGLYIISLHDKNKRQHIKIIKR